MRNIKNKGVFIKLFGSYMLILALVLMVEIGVSVKILDTSREQADILNQSLIQIVKNECDNQMENIYRSLDLLAFDNRVQVLSGVRQKSFQNENQYTAYSLYKELLNVQLSSDNYEHIYIYFKNTDSVISDAGNMSLELYYQLYYQGAEISLEELREYLTQKHYHDVRVIPGYALLCSMTSLKTDMGEPTAAIVIQIKPDSMNEKINAAKWDEAILAAIINSDNELINNTGFDSRIKGLRYETFPVGKNVFVELDKERYRGIAVQSTKADWIYVLLTPRSIIEKSAKQVGNYCLVGFLICLVLGFVAAYYLTSRNYNPVRGLMDLFRKEYKGEDAGVAEAENEYQWLEKQARKFFREYEGVQRSLDKNQQRLGDFCLRKLITQPYEELDSSEIELLRRKGITGYLRVVCLSVGTSVGSEGGESEGKQEITQELKRFIIQNVAGEVLNEAFQTEMLELENCVAALVHLDAMDRENYDKMWAALGKAFDVIKEHFHFCMQICSGTAKEGMENVYFSYLEAKETQQYALLLDTHFINYNDIKDRSQKYFYPRETENRIYNALMAGKSEVAVICIQEVLRTNCHQNHITAKLFRCLVYDILGTLMNSADEMGYRDFFEQYWEQLEDFDQLLKKPNEVEEQFTKMIEELCKEQERARSGGDTQLADMIQEYISQNYANPDLNISQVALYFKKTPAYISAVYKKQMGKGLLKSITQMRLEEAVRLLEEGKNVKDTACMSGFRDSRSFIRVFKENMGVTPGQICKK